MANREWRSIWEGEAIGRFPLSLKREEMSLEGLPLEKWQRRYLSILESLDSAEEQPPELLQVLQDAKIRKGSPAHEAALLLEEVFDEKLNHEFAILSTLVLHALEAHQADVLAHKPLDQNADTEDLEEQ